MSEIKEEKIFHFSISQLTEMIYKAFLKYYLNEYKNYVGYNSYDRNYLGNFKVELYGDDRPDMTPHFHFFNPDKSVNIEVSLGRDLRIIKVSSPANVKPDWKYFGDIGKNLKIWLDLKKENTMISNLNYLRDEWNAMGSKKIVNYNGDILLKPKEEVSTPINPEVIKILNGTNKKKKKK